MPPNWLLHSQLFLLIPFLLLFLFIPNVQNADVHCYTGGGNSPSNGSTLGLQNVCIGNDSCFLTINSNNSWSSGCVPPAGYANVSNPSATFCQQAANSQPAFCRCNSHFCNTPNNPNFLASLNNTLSNIIKPSDPGNLTCFECGNPLITHSNGTKSLSTMNVNCDGSKYCTGKYCVTRRSTIPRSYCATSWEDPKQLACQKLPGDQFDDQECICQQSFCNYPYEPLNYTTPAPTTPITTTTQPSTTALATTTATTTLSTTTMNSALPPGNWQCMNSCNASGITLTKDSTNTTKLDATFFESPAGCQKATVTCSGPAYSTVFFGNQGGLIAFQPNYTSVQALLYCIRNNNTNVWTRFGTSQDPNAQLTVNEAHCLVSASNATNTTSIATTVSPTATPPQSTPTTSTSTMSPPITTASPPPPGLFQCLNTCKSSEITMDTDTLNTNNFTSSLSEGPSGCGKLLLNCTIRSPTAAFAVIEFGQFARDGGLQAFQPNFTNVQALLYCIKHNKGNGNGSQWIRFGTSTDPNAMIHVNQARCNAYANNIIPTPSPTTTTTPIPSSTATTPSTTLGTTTIKPTTASPGNQTNGPWACVPGCNASQLAITNDSSGRTTIRAEHLPANSSMDCSKMRVTCTSNSSAAAAVGFGIQGTVMAFNYNGILANVTAELYCLRSNNTLSWTRFGTTRDPNAMFAATEAHCEMSDITTTTTAPLTISTPTTTTATTTTLPPSTMAQTNATIAPSTSPTPTTTLPPTTTISVNQSLPPGPWQCLTGCNASQVTLTRDTTNQTTLVSNGTFESPAGCAKLMVTCSAPPAAVVGFGNQGGLVAFQPNFTSVSALLYCIRNNGSLVWTRFGTTRDPNAMLTVTEAHCEVGVPPSSTSMPSTVPTTSPSTTTSTPPSTQPSTTTTSTATTTSTSTSTSTTSTSRPPTTPFTTPLIIPSPPTTTITTPTTMLITTTTSTSTSTTTPPPSTPPPTTVTATTLPPTTTTPVSIALPPGPWQCVTGCNASQVALSAGPSGIIPTFQSMAPNAGPLVTPTFESPTGCTKLLVNCASNMPAAMVMFGTLGNLTAFQPNFTSVSALLYCIRNNGSLVWTRFGTTRDPNAMLTVTQASCGIDAIPTSPPSTLPPSTPASTNATTTSSSTSTLPPSTPASTNATTTSSSTSTLPPSTPASTNATTTSSSTSTLPPSTPASTNATTTSSSTSTLPPSTPASTNATTTSSSTSTLPPSTPASTNATTTSSSTSTLPPSTPASTNATTTSSSTSTLPPSTPASTNATTTSSSTSTLPPSTPASTNATTTSSSTSTSTTTTSTTTSTTTASTTRPPSTPPSTLISSPPPTTTTNSTATATTNQTTPSITQASTTSSTPSTTTTTATTTRPSTVTSANITQQPQSNPNGTSYVCPDGRKFGPNELAVKMAEILKKSMLGGLYNNGNGISAVQNFEDGIKTHICNYS